MRGIADARLVCCLRDIFRFGGRGLSSASRTNRRWTLNISASPLGAFFGEASEDGQAVFSILFVFKKPLEREGRVQYEITHRRWPRESAP
jgi:hypothetical protein